MAYAQYIPTPTFFYTFSPNRAVGVARASHHGICLSCLQHNLNFPDAQVGCPARRTFANVRLRGPHREVGICKCAALLTGDTDKSVFYSLSHHDSERPCRISANAKISTNTSDRVACQCMQQSRLLNKSLAFKPSQ